MELKRICALMLAVCLCGLASLAAAATPTPTPQQDPVILRFAERVLPFFPGSKFEIVSDSRTRVPSGSYRLVSIKRDCANEFLSGTQVMVIDEAAHVAWVGAVGGIPDPAQAAANLRGYVDQAIPKLLEGGLGFKVKVSWEADGVKSGALVPFTLLASSGYGEYRKPAAISTDGKVIVIAAPYPLDQDPVALRRELLRNHPGVIRDHGPADAQVEIVEFSDFECPGCKKKWPLIKSVLEENGDKVSHSMVGFPLTRIHPWAFRAATAAWCVGREQPEMLAPLKELFYSVQGDMKIDMVKSTAGDFVAGYGMAEAEFGQCYLKPPSVDGVLEQMSLGHRLGVMATPTYYFNGWQVQVPQEEWIGTMVRRLLSGMEP